MMPNDTKPKQCNNIYKNLCIYSLEPKKYIDRKDFGITGAIISNTLTIGETYTVHKVEKHLDDMKSTNKILPKKLVMANFGVLNLLYKKVEGKSNERAETNTIQDTNIK